MTHLRPGRFLASGARCNTCICYTCTCTCTCYIVHVTPAPVTSAPVTPVTPVTPAPFTPTPVAPAPVTPASVSVYLSQLHLLNMHLSHLHLYSPVPGPVTINSGGFHHLDVRELLWLLQPAENDGGREPEGARDQTSRLARPGPARPCHLVQVQ